MENSDKLNLEGAEKINTLEKKEAGLGELKEKMMEDARRQYRDIFLPGNKKTWDECFTFEQSEGKLILWFNTSDNSTHTLAKNVSSS